mmetsp:Transcript_15450/g.43229  ORF Transcript_15450/g.43229 Transcript_15450/m.43229 type:complete len:230 (-) Transcript_15450:1133-1822(-)
MARTELSANSLAASASPGTSSPVVGSFPLMLVASAAAAAAIVGLSTEAGGADVAAGPGSATPAEGASSLPASAPSAGSAALPDSPPTAVLTSSPVAMASFLSANLIACRSFFVGRLSTLLVGATFSRTHTKKPPVSWWWGRKRMQRWMFSSARSAAGNIVSLTLLVLPTSAKVSYQLSLSFTFQVRRPGPRRSSGRRSLTSTSCSDPFVRRRTSATTASFSIGLKVQVE